MPANLPMRLGIGEVGNRARWVGIGRILVNIASSSLRTLLMRDPALLRSVLQSLTRIALGLRVIQ